MELFAGAILLGLLGSIHCVGMCGPIALALPAVNRTMESRIAGILLYNGGRIITYSALGLVFGLLGKTFIIAGFQQALSIIAGLAILTLVLIPYLGFKMAEPLFKATSKFKGAFAKVLRQRSYAGLMGIGILNGFLPCGLVYTAVAGAIATGRPLGGSLFMAVFGLGTVPAMLALPITGQSISMNLRNSFRKITPVFVAFMAVLLIIRGLNLGIPYVSPALSKTDCTKHSCCHK